MHICLLYHTPVSSYMTINHGTQDMFALKSGIMTSLKGAVLKDSLTFLCLWPLQIYILFASRLLVPSIFVAIIDPAPNLPICPHFLPSYASWIFLRVFFKLLPMLTVFLPLPALTLTSYVPRSITSNGYHF